MKILIFDEQQVLWAMATRIQADKNIVITPQNMGMGDMLDPSADDLTGHQKLELMLKPCLVFLKVEIDKEVRKNTSYS